MLALAAPCSPGREHASGPSLYRRRGAGFLGGSFLLAVLLFAAGIQTAELPNLSRLGVLLVLCAVQVAFFSPVIWNHVLRHL